MSSKDPAVPARTLVRGSVLPAFPIGAGPARRVAVSLGAARRSVVRSLNQRRHRPPTPPTGRMLVLVPAHDVEATIARTLEALLTQSRLPDRIVVLADDCTDRTEEIARRFRGVTVMRTVENTGGEAGALDQGRRRWQAGYDHVAAVAAGTVLAPDRLQRLETELARTTHPRDGGTLVVLRPRRGLER